MLSAQPMMQDDRHGKVLFIAQMALKKSLDRFRQVPKLTSFVKGLFGIKLHQFQNTISAVGEMIEHCVQFGVIGFENIQPPVEARICCGEFGNCDLPNYGVRADFEPRHCHNVTGVAQSVRVRWFCRGKALFRTGSLLPDPETFDAPAASAVFFQRNLDELPMCRADRLTTGDAFPEACRLI